MGSNTKDIAAGIFFIAVGAWFSLNAWLTLSLGTASRMGAGYFPIILGIVLALLGAGIMLKSFNAPSGAMGSISVRGVVLISLAPVIFGLTVRGLGMVGAVFLSILVASFSSERVSIGIGLLLSLGLTTFCILVFHYGLGLPFDLFGPWLSALGL